MFLLFFSTCSRTHIFYGMCNKCISAIVNGTFCYQNVLLLLLLLSQNIELVIFNITNHAMYLYLKVCITLTGMGRAENVVTG